ncbi:MAG: alpha/beta hydrolase [Silanimonas sp.]|jgi:pimeloyl-ACP methyl ester carboxylesterase|nr:alpha/beta hydrolase [Silanimonas sp.]
MNANSLPQAVEHHTVVINGLSTFYRAAGQPSQPVIVLLHGFPSSSHMFRDLIPLLADRFRVIAPDYIGFGHSAAPTADEFEYTFDNLTGQVQSLLDHLKITDAIYYMQDYGGPVGLRLATSKPERVRGLVVQNANAYMEGLTPAVAGVFMPLWEKGDESGARQMLLAETTKMQYTAGARRPEQLNPDAWVLDQALLDRPGSTDRHLALFKDYQRNVPLFDVWQAYFRQHQPKTLVAWGKGDPFFGVPGAEAFRRDLKDVRVELLDSGHFALEEDAPRVAELIKQAF